MADVGTEFLEKLIKKCYDVLITKVKIIFIIK